MSRLAAIVLVVTGLFGCQESAELSAPPPPVTLTAEAAGHYCQMTVLDHPGPKAQVHLVGFQEPLWFTQVRDAVAFDRMPEQTAEVAAIYVNDMGAAPDWANPGVDNWINARDAYFVAGSGRRGGMGAPEIVPFASQDRASAFAAEHGGTVLTVTEITDDMVLGPVDVDPEGMLGGGEG